MKKAFIDQIFFGWLLLTAIVVFIGTSTDEKIARNKVYDLDDLAFTYSKAAASSYLNSYSMCSAQEISEDILKEMILGSEIYENNQIEIVWKDTNFDNVPDSVTTTISGYKQENFWYKFLGKKSFDLPTVSEEAEVDAPFDLDIYWGGEDAGYTNMIGVYELDSDNCVSNPRIILANSDDTSLSAGDSLDETITSPPEYFFIVSDGYDTFTSTSTSTSGRGRNRTTTDYPDEDDDVTMTWCYDDAEGSSLPTVEINGVTNDETQIFFEDISLNQDEYHHIHSIPESIWDEYNTYITNYNATYDEFIEYADSLNEDDDVTNDIDYTDDPDNEYQYAMEDLYNGGDEDFNDIYLNTIKSYTNSEATDDYTIDEDGNITLNCP